MPFKTPITIADALEKMHRHEFVLPAIQREFVWGPERICTLFDSLMRGYPVGSLLFWHVDGDTVGSLTFYDFVRTYHQRNAPHCPVLDVEKGRPVTAVLDGQQRLTALNIGLRGSHAEKLPRLWAGNPNAYPVKKLYLDLLFVADDNDLDQRYRFRFLTPAEAADRRGQFWFEVARIRTFKDSFDALTFAEQNSLGIASGRTLLRLYEAVHKEATLNYFEEMEQDLEKVLNIFIRVNSKAVALSSSDLLLSVATAQWRDRDAREVIHQLVDDLNDTGQGFAFTKDLVLKAGLVLLGRGDIRSKVGNFDRQTMREMEDAWDDIDRAPPGRPDLEFVRLLSHDVAGRQRTHPGGALSAPARPERELPLGCPVRRRPGRDAHLAYAVADTERSVGHRAGHLAQRAAFGARRRGPARLSTCRAGTGDGPAGQVPALRHGPDRGLAGHSVWHPGVSVASHALSGSGRRRHLPHGPRLP